MPKLKHCNLYTFSTLYHSKKLHNDVSQFFGWCLLAFFAIWQNISQSSYFKLAVNSDLKKPHRGVTGKCVYQQLRKKLLRSKGRQWFEVHQWNLRFRTNLNYVHFVILSLSIVLGYWTANDSILPMSLKIGAEVQKLHWLNCIHTAQ